INGTSSVRATTAAQAPGSAQPADQAPTMAPDSLQVSTPGLPTPVTTPPANPPMPDTLVKGLVHGAEDDAAKALDFVGKVPFLRDIGYKLYGMVSGPPKDSPTVDNLGGLTPNLYRGAQPSAEGFQTLAANGVKTVINLRPEEQWEKPMVEKAGMKYVYLPLPPVGPPTNQEALQFLSLVTDPANGKVYFHCQHGADRTGAMAAAYRIAVQGWTPEQAIAEMPEYKFHAGIEDAKVSFVQQFGKYWASLPADQRAKVLHGIPTAPLAAADTGKNTPLPQADVKAPTPQGAVDAGGGVQMSAGNSVQLFTDRKNSYQEALKLINSAKTSIQFETFTFNGQMGQGIADALIKARQRGVNVQVVLDPKQLLVSDGNGLKNLLLANGIDVRLYNETALNDPVVAIDHAKQLIVDGQTALAGDSNFDRYEDYDMDYQLQGPAVAKLQAMFAQSWTTAKAAGTISSAGLPPVKPVPVATGAPVPGADTSIGITETAPEADGRVGDQTYQDTLNAINKSKKSIDVLMYTMSDTGEIDALKAAAQRGVKVRVVLSPSKATYNSKAVEDLEAAGIQVRWFNLAHGQHEMHGKVAVFDGKTVLGGSTNWVHSSAADNHELGVWMQGPVADQVETTFNQIWTTGSRPAQLSKLGQIEAEVMDGVSRFL
ncbi:MAG TPA: phospholipase D-like domain-containing protein, partial [Oscillatoriaceae cyanobacterium]